MSTYDVPNKPPPHERCSYITKNILLGAHPIVSTLQKIEDHGVDIFIDLREQTNYTTTKQKYHFPIIRGKAPSKNQAEAILKIVLDNTDKLIYIHCNGGHGRAGTIGSYIIGKIYEFDAYEAITHIEKCRDSREDKTRNFIPTPEMTCQVNFLVRELGLKAGHIAPDRKNISWITLLKAN